MSVPGRGESGRSRRAAGALESEVLGVLWAATEPVTAAEVQAELGDDLAYNTVLTILTRLHDKGLAGRVARGRAYAYAPTKPADELTAERMHALLRQGPDRQSVLQHFVGTLDEDDARLLRSVLRRMRRR